MRGSMTTPVRCERMEVRADTDETTSTSLIKRLQEGESDAWERLCAIYGPLVYRWARLAGLQDQDAADIGQEVFRTVAARIATFEHERRDATFRGWLWAITHHKLGDHFRRRATRPQAVGGTSAYESLQRLEYHRQDELPQDPEADAGLMHRALEAVRESFEDSTWQAFWRVTVEGHAAADVAADLQVSTQAVRQAKCRVLRRLRVDLGEITP